MADELVKGIRVFNKSANAPDFVKLSLVITLNELIQFAKDNPDLQTEYNGQKQLKVQVLESKAGGLYCKVDNYKKPDNATVNKSASMTSKKSVTDDDSSDLPF